MDNMLEITQKIWYETILTLRITFFTLPNMFDMKQYLPSITFNIA